MPDTNYMRLGRSAYGRPYDNRDVNFDPVQGDYDLTDELTKAMAKYIPYISFQGAPESIPSSYTNISLSLRRGSFAPNGVDVYNIKDGKVETVGAATNISYVTEVWGSSTYSGKAIALDGAVLWERWYDTSTSQWKWASHSVGGLSDVYTVGFMPSSLWANDTFLAAGIGAARSTDGGATWSKINGFFINSGDEAYDVDVSKSGIMAFALRNSGDNSISVQYSSDDTTWSVSAVGISGTDRPYIFFDGSYWILTHGTTIAVSANFSSWSTYTVSGSSSLFRMVRIGNLLVGKRSDNTSIFIDRDRLVIDGSLSEMANGINISDIGGAFGMYYSSPNSSIYSDYTDVNGYVAIYQDSAGRYRTVFPAGFSGS